MVYNMLCTISCVPHRMYYVEYIISYILHSASDRSSFMTVCLLFFFFFSSQSGLDRNGTVGDIRPGTNFIDMNSTQTTCSLPISNLCSSKEIKDISYFDNCYFL